MKKILLVLGTRPEVIKLAVLARDLASHPEVQLKIVSTGQHRELVSQMLGLFGLKADLDLDLMLPGQALSSLFARSVEGVARLIRVEKPDWIVVQGDTSSAAAAATAGFLERVPVAHVEAGLRTYDLESPWPEEFNRRAIALAASLHLAPTRGAGENLLREGIPPDRVLVTGNTGIDALFWMREYGKAPSRWNHLRQDLPLILCTFHRREAFGSAMEGIFEAVAELAEREEAELILPLHPNPKVQEAARKVFRELPRLHLTAPLPYDEFVWLMNKANLLLSDSGGVQEEAPSIGKPVVITREKTERPEAVEAGASVLAGTSKEGVLREVRRVLKPEVLKEMSRPRPVYGDGKASERIREALLRA